MAVTASAQDEIRGFTITLGAGGELGVAVSVGVNVLSADTEAYIGAGAQINQTSNSSNAGAGQSVLVGAGDDFYNMSLNIGLAIGGSAAAAPSIGVNTITNTTKATIGDGAKVAAQNEIAVIATATETVVQVGMGVAVGGTVGGGAVIDVLTVSNTTEAAIGNSAVISAVGDVCVIATDTTHVLDISGAVGVGGELGIGASVGVIVLNKTTEATVGISTKVDALGGGGVASNGVAGILTGTATGGNFNTQTAHGVIVQAQSGEDITHIVIAGAAGGTGAVAGAIGVCLITSTTEAVIDAGALINTVAPGSANADQGVYVEAANNASISSYVIGVAVGGYAGIAGSIDVGALSNNTFAQVDTGVTIKAARDVAVNAVSQKNLVGYVISGDGGFVGAGASVSVWSLGTQVTGSYSDTSGNSANATNVGGSSSATGYANSQPGTATSFVAGSGGLGSLGGNSAGNNNSGNRVHNAAASASTSVSGAAPTSSQLAAMEAAIPATPPGTAAIVQAGAVVDAGRNISVTATEAASITEVLGQVSGGVVGAGAAVGVFTIGDNVTAADDGSNSAGAGITQASTLPRASLGLARRWWW